MSRPDFRQAYQTEAADLLEEIEETLLGLEAQPDDLEACHRLFRAMHTIKGNGAMFGFTAIAGFAHHVETALDEVRNGRLPVTPELIDLVLESQDHLKKLLNEPDDGGAQEAASAGLVARFEALTSFAPVSSDTSADPEDAVKTSSGAAEARFSVELAPPEDFFANGQDPLSLLDDVRRLGPCEITIDVAALPAFDVLDPELCYLRWKLVTSPEGGKSALDDIFLFVDEAVSVSELADDEGAAAAPEVLDASVVAALTEVAACLQALEEDAPAPKRDPLLQQGDRSLALVEEHARGADWPVYTDLCQQVRTGLVRWLKRGSTRQGDLLTYRDAVAMLRQHLGTPKTLTITPEFKARLEGKAEQRQAPSSDSGAATLRIQVDKIDQLIDLVGEVALVHSEVNHRRQARQTDEEDDQAAHRLDMLLRQLQDTSMALRMIPIEGSFQRMKRLIRDLSKTLDKPVDLHLSGGDTEIDRSIAERINDPLVHMLRNCMDHGIESPDERAAAGKSPRGRIELSASQAGGEIQVCIRDDGRGLNLERILQRARERGVCGPDEAPDAQAIANFIFEPGFSTAAQVTDLSGRGVGMDVVQTNLTAMRGRVSTVTKAGLGTKFTLHIPLTLAIVDAMVMRVGATLFAVPIETVLEIVQPEATQLISSCAESREMLQHRERPLPVVRLRDYFGLSGKDAALEGRPVLAVECDGHPVALTMDELIGQQQLVTKPLQGPLAGIRAAAGCGLLGSGDVAVVLDARQLTEASQPSAN